MAIYLDSNVLYPWRTFTELDRVALSIVAWQTKQLVVVPWLVAEEARANYRRSLQGAVEDLDSALRGVNRLFDDLDEVVRVEPQPWIDGQVATWEARLTALAHVLDFELEDAGEALKREVWGIAPTRRPAGKSGLGARDAAIWLAVARDHAARGEDGHFISKDGHFFSAGKLRPPMEDDLASGHALHLYDGIAQFLELLGSAEEASVDISELVDAVRSIRVVFEQALHVPRAVFEEFDQRRRYRTVIKEARPVRVLAARRYAQQKEALLVVDSEWELVADMYHQEWDASEGEQWFHHEDIHLHGTVQMYLPSPDHPDLLPQIINARLKSDTTVWIRDDQVIGMRSSEPF